MERALNRDLIALALGERDALPSSAEVIDALEEAEVQLFLGNAAITQELIDVAWYLHGVASSPRALEAYSFDRQRRCFQVSAHIFDLRLEQEGFDPLTRLRLAFASQIGYLHSELNPNARAVHRRVEADTLVESFLVDFPKVALSLGCHLLAFDRASIYGPTKRMMQDVRELERKVEVDALSETMFGATSEVACGIDDLLTFMTYGPEEKIATAKEHFRRAVEAPGALGDFDARWVAAHLLRFSEGIFSSSIWGILPPSVPTGVKRAFALSEPSVLTLWPPQAKMFRGGGGPDPLSSAVKRVFVSFPTSAGKTLLAQIFAVNHLAQNSNSVAYVAPTHSLCREVRDAFRQRLSLLRREVRMDTSVWGEVGLAPAAVEVMTPENLAYRLRADPQSVLDRFGMFIIDEAHTVGDNTRGLTLEAVLTLLQIATTESFHKIVLLSPAIGNRVHFVHWLDPAGDGVDWHEDWRGPRRLAAIYTTEGDRESAVVQDPGGRVRVRRSRMPLHGVVRLYTGPNREPRKLRTTEPVGTLVTRPDEDYARDPETTPFYKQLVPLVKAVGEAGPVLVISPTKREARYFAAALSAHLPEATGQVLDLADFVSRRLGAAHPAVSALRKGVAIHYASLPNDVLVAVEDAIRDSLIAFVVATTTLTEGVNLPVRTVVIAAEGAHTGSGFEILLEGPRMINALGRAGRAGRESEGWVVLARNARYRPTDFNRITLSSEDVSIISELAVSTALTEFASLEQQLSSLADDVLERGIGISSRFTTFAWFALNTLSKLGYIVDDNVLFPLLSGTLAWNQLDEVGRSRLQSVGRRAVRSYLATDSATRDRWAAAGTSIASARLLDQLASDIAAESLRHRRLLSPVDAFALMAGGGRLQRLLELPEAPQKSFRTRIVRGRPIEVDLPSLAISWLLGQDLPELAEQYLGEVEDESYQLEQLVEYVTEVFSHYLAWTLGLLVDWTNERLSVYPEAPTLPASLGAFLREGVSSTNALELLRGGVTSRRIANLVSLEYQRDTEHLEDPPSLNEWLADLPLGEWRQRFVPSFRDVAELLDFSKAEGILGALFDEESVEIEFLSVGLDPPLGNVELKEIGEDPPPRRVGLWREDQLVGYVPVTHQSDVSAFLATGLAYEATVASHRGLIIRMIEVVDVP